MSDRFDRPTQPDPARRSRRDDFLSGRGIGNEIAFFIFDYPPEDELRVREHIRVPPRPHPEAEARPAGQARQPVRLRASTTSRNAKLLDKAFEMQKEKGDEALLKALRGMLHEEKLAQRFAEVAQAATSRTWCLSPASAVCGRASFAHPAEQPARRHGEDAARDVLPRQVRRDRPLRLFGKTRRSDNYYRAFRLIP